MENTNEIGKKSLHAPHEFCNLRSCENSKVLLGVAQWGALEVKVKKD